MADVTTIIKISNLENPKWNFKFGHPVVFCSLLI